MADNAPLLGSSNEPVIIIEFIKVFVANLVTMAVAFGFAFTDVQIGALMGVVNSGLMILGAIWQRSLVKPVGGS